VRGHPALGDADTPAPAEDGNELWGQVAALPPKQRAVVVLKYYLDYDEAAIALTMGSPRGTVKSRLHLARARLRASLNLEVIGG